MTLEGKVAIVTGGGRGIGRGIALCLADAGADVAIMDKDAAGAAQVAQEVAARGRRSLPLTTDVLDRHQVQQAVDSVLAAWGHIDILVNNAGGGASAVERVATRLADQEEADWDEAYQLNLKSQFIVCREVVPHLVKQRSGKIINISSVAGKVGDSFRMPYSAAKGGVIAFTRSLAMELARHNINVNCVCPGLVYTPLWEVAARRLAQVLPGYAELSPRQVFERWVERLIPMKREQTPEDVGRLVAFLASEAARNITGQAINVDGGLSVV